MLANQAVEEQVKAPSPEAFALRKRYQNCSQTADEENPNGVSQ